MKQKKSNNKHQMYVNTTLKVISYCSKAEIPTQYRFNVNDFVETFRTTRNDLRFLLVSTHWLRPFYARGLLQHTTLFAASNSYLTHMRQTCSGRVCYEIDHCDTPSSEDQQLSLACVLLARALCIQVKIRPIGHRHRHVILSLCVVHTHNNKSGTVSNETSKRK